MDLNFNVKGAIIKTISEAIYSGVIDKIREIVANSVDAKSNCVVMSYDKDEKEISMFDNGKGLDETEIKKIFESLGYGIGRDNPNTLSHFGLGLISILQLATTKAYIYSKMEGKPPILLEINTKELFSKENEDKELSKFSEYLHLHTEEENGVYGDIVKTKSRIAKVLEKQKELKTDYNFNTFTEIILLNVKDNDLENIDDENFEILLKKTLPLPINESDSFFNKITDKNLKKEMIDFYSSEEFCSQINFYTNNESHIGYELDETEPKEEADGYRLGLFKKLYKYFPSFGRLQEITRENLVIEEKDDFKFYLLAKVDDLFTQEEGEQGKKISGFTIRNKNFLVKENDFFEYKNVRSIHKPLRTWIYGEIFHKDLNDVLQVSRRDVVDSKEKFINFAQSFVSTINNINTNLRNAYKARNEIRKEFLSPLKKITSGNMFKEIDNKITQPFKQNSVRLKEQQNMIIEKLKNKPKKKWYNNEKYLLENIISESDIEWQYEKVDIVISNTVNTDSGDDLLTPISGTLEKSKLKISPDFFKTREVKFLGNDFRLKFVYLGKDSNKEEAINFSVTETEKDIYINIFNDKIKNFKIDVIEVIILINVAYEQSDNLEDMKEYILDYLEGNYESTANYTIVKRLNEYLLKTKSLR